METPKRKKRMRRLLNEPIEDFGGTPQRNRKKLSIGTMVLAVMHLIRTSVGAGSHMLKMAFVFNRIQDFYDGIMIDAMGDNYGSHASLFKRGIRWGSFDVHEFVRHQARLCCRADFAIVRLII